MGENVLISCIHQAITYGWKTICITGGEPFLVPELLYTTSNLCRKNDVNIAIQTNGFWGKNPKKYLELLRSLRGITQLGFSIDKAHLVFVEIEYIVKAIQYAISSGINRISVSVSYQTLVEYETIKSQFQSIFPGIEVVGWPILPIGRAKYHPELSVDYFAYTWDRLQRNCDLQRQMNPVIHPNGDFHPCYRTVMALEEKDPLILGNVIEKPFEELLLVKNNLLLLFILAYGGGGLGYLLKNSPFEDLLNQKHQSVCHFCYNVLSSQDALTYMQNILYQGGVEPKIMAGLEKLKMNWKRQPKNYSEVIKICKGKSCGYNQKNYPVMNYLINRLYETNKSQYIKVEFVDCLNSCGYGPNLFLESKNQLIQQATLEIVDNILDQIKPPANVNFALV
jgi:NADH:ubiquinone oxidoreductase subunit E